MPAKQAAKSPAPPSFDPNPRIGSEQLTDLLKSALQTVRVAYLTVGTLLTLVRDEKRYAELGFADLERYARERLQLGRTSLFTTMTSLKCSRTPSSSRCGCWRGLHRTERPE